MFPQINGYTVSRVIPQDCVTGLVTGAYKLCGGVIRKRSGEIVAHLIDGSNPLDMLQPVNAAFGAVNAFRLHKIGKDLAELKDTTATLEKVTYNILALAKGTMLLSGLTLTVSAASFLFLFNKLVKIDQKLKILAKNVKSIDVFLKSKEKASLITALKTLSGIDSTLGDDIRVPLLVNARQTLGEIHERYRQQLETVTQLVDIIPIEEYYSITALGHAMCSAELGMLNRSVSDLDDAYTTWTAAIRRLSNSLIIREDPERFLLSAYTNYVRTDEVIDWLDFAKGEDRGIEWVDHLRSQMTYNPLRRPKVDPLEIEVIRKATARNRIYSGYSAQYRFMEGLNIRPSFLERYCQTLNEEDRVNDCFLLIANPTHPEETS